jgi:type III restriction enzyme
MKLQFDANQQYQLDAVASVTDLFEGQPQGAPEYSIIQVGGWDGLFAGQARTELGLCNQLLLAPDKLLANTRSAQTRNDIEITSPAAPLEAWDVFDAAANAPRTCPHFSIEMETGTGKTYVYLRTIFELSRRYGFQKFIIVVPSVAIREGVLKNIEITKEHFQALYNNLPFEHFVYDAKKVNRLRQFAVSNTVQICIINIQAFNKKELAVIYKESDKLSGRQPIEFVQATRPIVIIDEPQSVEGGEEGAGMAALASWEWFGVASQRPPSAWRRNAQPTFAGLSPISSPTYRTRLNSHARPSCEFSRNLGDWPSSLSIRSGSWTP